MKTPKKLEGLAPRRKAVGLTQEQLAAALDVERVTLAMWETGRSWPSAKILPKIADLLCCSIDDLYEAPEEVDLNAGTLDLAGDICSYPCDHVGK